jgi:hypothetical protein
MEGIEEIIQCAIKKYEQRKIEIEDEYEKVTSVLENEYQTKKTNQLESYFTFIYSDLDQQSDEYKLQSSSHHQLFEEFIEDLGKSELVYKKKIEKIDMNYQHQINSLEMKHSENIRLLEDLRNKYTEHTRKDSWFSSVFDSESDKDGEDDIEDDIEDGNNSEKMK